MGSTSAELLTRVRRELGDETVPYTWSDNLLTDLSRAAVDWYSLLYPDFGLGYWTVAEDQRAFEWTSGWLDVIAIECPLGNLLPQESEALAGDPTRYGGVMRQAWSKLGHKVYLRNPAKGDEVGPSKIAAHCMMQWPIFDPIERWTGPSWDERLIELYMCREAYAYLDGQDQKLGRAHVTANGMLARFYDERLEAELATRRRRASSRTMDVVR